MRRKKGSTVVRLLVVFIIVSLALAAVVFLGRNQLRQYSTRISDLENNIDTNKKVVYVADGDIEAGTKLEIDVNIYRQQIASGISSDYYIQDADFSRVQTALIDIPDGQPIMKNMATPNSMSGGDKEVEINFATMMVDSKVNDFVDIRIAFPDGSDYCVLSKKQIKKLVYESSIWYTDLNEQEILTMTSMVTDAYTVSGSYIYLTRYINPTIQEATKCDYPVNTIAYNMINGTGETIDYNVDRTSATFEKMTETLNALARSRLEMKLSELSKEELAAITAGRGIQDTAQSSAYTNMIRHQEELDETATEELEYVYENYEDEETEEGDDFVTTEEGAAADSSSEDTSADSTASAQSGASTSTAPEEGVEEIEEIPEEDEGTFITLDEEGATPSVTHD